MEVFTNTDKVLHLPQDDPGADPLQPPTRAACPASAATTASCRSWPSTTGVDDEALHGRRLSAIPIDDNPPLTWCGTTPSASCAAAAWPLLQEAAGGGLSSAPTSGAYQAHIGCAFETSLAEFALRLLRSVHCGLSHWRPDRKETDTAEVWAAICTIPTSTSWCSTAPAIRATLGECFGLPIGTNVEGKMVAALRRLGFDAVFDMDTAADFTIMEEAHRVCCSALKSGGTLPLITTCCPGWVKFCEHYYPDMMPNLSSCKSPQQMFGALLKTYYAEKIGH